MTRYLASIGVYAFGAFFCNYIGGNVEGFIVGGITAIFVLFIQLGS